jgi:hypothetical protein
VLAVGFFSSAAIADVSTLEEESFLTTEEGGADVEAKDDDDEEEERGVGRSTKGSAEDDEAREAALPACTPRGKQGE